MTKNTKTYYMIILDKSGSMGSVINATVEGFNEQVQMIKNLEGKYPDQKIRVSLTTFNNVIYHDLFLKKPSEMKELQPPHHRENNSSELIDNGKITYSPGGMTALYDAIGLSVKKLKKEIKEEIKKDKASAVVVIITDGHENSSTIFSYGKIQKMIGKLEKSKNWTFSYLGATPDAVKIASGLNINEHNSMYFNNDNIDQILSRKLFNSLNRYMSAKSVGSISMEFLDKTKKDKKDKD